MLAPEEVKRRETIRELAAMGLKGTDYCREMDKREMKLPPDMIRRGCLRRCGQALVKSSQVAASCDRQVKEMRDAAVLRGP